MTKKKTTKKKDAPTVKIEFDAGIVELLYKIISVCPSKKLIKLLDVIYMQENISYITTTLALLADKKDVENVETTLALTFLINNWDEAVKEGGKILGEKLNKIEKEK